MRKSFKLDEIDCSVCAGKLEVAINKLDCVTVAKVNILTQKLTLEADDASFDQVLDAVVKLTADIEPDCEILRETSANHHATTDYRRLPRKLLDMLAASPREKQ